MKNLQFFAAPSYCPATGFAGVAGKDILLCVYDSTGDELLAVAGQQSLTINRTADSIEVSSKDTEGGWKSSIAGMKEWSIDTDGLYVASDESHKTLKSAFANGDPVCICVRNNKTDTNMFGGLASITEYTLEAPYDDAMTYSLSLSGVGALVDLSEEEDFVVTPSALTVAAGDSVTATLANATGSVSAAVSYSGVTASVSGSTLTVTASGSAAAGTAVVLLTDSAANTVVVRVTITE